MRRVTLRQRFGRLQPGLSGLGAAALATIGALILAAAFVSSASGQTPGGDAAPRAFEVDVAAEVLEADAPLSVAAAEVVQDDQGRLAHGVVVTWNDAADAELSDERFTHHVSAIAPGGAGDLVLSGRGCGAQWAESEQEVVFPCTLDLRITPVSPGSTHEYPLWIQPQVGPLTLETGQYVVEQQVFWWRPATPEVQQHFTVRLTYDVTEAPVATGISVDASIVEASAPVDVAVTEVAEVDGLPSHGVRVTWQGAGRAILDDARFTHHTVSGEVSATTPESHLITTGRGCGASVDEGGEVSQYCTDDLRIIDLAPGETHEYPVCIHPALDGLLLRPGTYTVEESIGWRASQDGVPVGARQEFTVRLVYTVTAGEPGILTPEPAPTGITLATWSGGPIADLPQATSYWITASGEYVGYLPAAPAFVNADFLTRFPSGTLPAGTSLVVVRWPSDSR
ncbi:MAG: hypothetical protein M0R73_09175 [Dehalococcoidia bacterium]|nr:hypothetical protein [Dehalococcoidia bacterium]